jgi:hypothetical protein
MDAKRFQGTGICEGPIVHGQDNQSTMTLIEKGKSTPYRNRHVDIRYFFIKGYVDKDIVRVVYVPSEDIVADILPKLLHSNVFRKPRRKFY